MVIKTGKSRDDQDAPEVVVPPDKGRPASRKSAQRFQRSRRLAARLLTVVKIVGAVCVLLLTAATMISAYRYAASSNLLRLRKVDIYGCKRLDPARLEAVVRDSCPTNLLGVDLLKLRSRIEEVPWVHRAEIRRILPSSLKIYVQERVPTVIGEVGGELELLDNDGVLLDHYEPSYGKLDVPVFSGLLGDSVEAYRVLQEQNSARVRLGVQLLAEIEAVTPDSTRSISEVDLSDPGNIKIVLVDDTAEVFLGDRDFGKRFHAFMTEYPEAKSQYGEMTSVNLRFFPDIVYNPKHPPVVKPETGVASRQTSRN